MQYLWTGQLPANRAPRIEDFRIGGQAARDNVYLKPGSLHTATLKAEDPEGDRLTFQWEIVPEVPRGGYAGAGERRPASIRELIQKAGGHQLIFTAPGMPWPYRVFFYVFDSQGNAATANIPFFVKP